MSLKNNNDLKLKHELEFVYIDSSGKKYLKKIDALCAEAQIQLSLDTKLQKKKRIMDIIELVMKVLHKENWGVYYKNQPIQPLEMQDGNSLYKVNQVDECDIETAIDESLTKDNTWETLQKNSSQNKNSTSG